MARRTHYAKIGVMSKDALAMFLARYINCATGECPVSADCRKKEPSDACYKEFRRWLDLVDAPPKKPKEKKEKPPKTTAW